MPNSSVSHIPCWIKKGNHIEYAFFDDTTKKLDGTIVIKIVSNPNGCVKTHFFSSDSSELKETEFDLDEIAYAQDNMFLVGSNSGFIPFVKTWDLKAGDFVFCPEESPLKVIEEEVIETPIGRRRSIKLKAKSQDEIEDENREFWLILWFDKITGILLKAIAEGLDLGKDSQVRLLIESTNIAELHQEKPITFIEVQSKGDISAGKGDTASVDMHTYGNKVFIVHGKDDRPKLELARMLEKDLGLEAIILHEQPSEGRTIIESIEKFSDVGYAFIILTPDDVGLSSQDIAHESSLLKRRPRQNVIFEFGFFVGKLGRKRTCCLYQESVEELPSDIHGIVYKKFRQSVRECYADIVKELKAAGYKLPI